MSEILTAIALLSSAICIVGGMWIMFSPESAKAAERENQKEKR